MLARNPTGSLVIYRLGAHERAQTARGGRRCSSTSCPLQLRRRQGQGRRHDDHRRDHVRELSRFSLDCPELARALAAGVEHLEVGRDLSWEDVIHSAMRRS